MKSGHTEKVCHFCKKKGHIRADCYKLKKRNRIDAATIDNGKQLENKGQANVKENFLLFLMGIPNLVNIRYLTRLVNFICPNRGLFSTYEKALRGAVIIIK